jgi:uncharacterized protein
MMTKMSRFAFLLGGGLLLVLVGSWALNRLRARMLTSTATSDTSPTGQTKAATSGWSLFGAPEPSPIPFEEMTVPWLRERSYTSTLESTQQVAQNARYTSYLSTYQSDGLKIQGLLTRPTGQMPEGGWPAVVFVHGFIAPTTYRTREKYVEYVDNLARNGFVVFKIDLRGHGTSEGEPGGAYYSSDYIIDTLNAYAALQTSEFVNPSKVGLWGHSMAGNVTLRALAAKPEIPAAVIWAGAVYTYEDFREYGIQDNSYRPPSTSSARIRRRQELFDTYGQPTAESSFWSQVAPTNYLGDVKGAIQIHHAVNDTVVNVEYSRNLNRILNETSVPHEYYEYPQGGHNITGASYSQAMQRTVQFYKAKLQ